MAQTFKLGTVELGSFGSHVLLVQEILKARGYVGADGKPLKLDGDAGTNTMYAIECYIKDGLNRGADLGGTDAWGPLCWADQAWEKVE